MAKGITDRELKALLERPPEKRQELKDGTIDGLTVRVGPRGKPAWTFRFRLLGAGGVTGRGTKLNGVRYHRVALGIYPALSVKEAREKAAAYLASIERGENPLERLEDEAVDGQDTVNSLVQDYLAHAKESMRSWRNAGWILNRHVTPEWGDRPAGTILERDARKLVEKVRKGQRDRDDGKEGPRNGAAAEARKWGSMLFEWARKNGRVKANPFADVPVPKLGSRQRFLSMEEARVVWTAGGMLNSPWREAVRLLMLTGCREMEICAGKWPWLVLADATFMIPPEHFKSGKHFLVCLPTAAVDIFREIQRSERGDFILSTTDGHKPIAGIPRKKLDELHRNAEQLLGRSIKRFALHDLRRTVRTHLARLGVDDVVAELVLGHALKGLQARYNVHSFENEKRAALNRWADELIPPASA